MSGVGKRAAAVPQLVRVLGDCMSKADLLEVAYHFALLLDEEDSDRALRRIAKETEILRGKPVRIPKPTSGNGNHVLDRLRAALHEEPVS